MTFESIAEKHRRELIAHCYRMLGSLSEAEDLAQDTLLKAWKAYPQFEGRSSVRTWLYKIATNACLDAREKKRPILSVDSQFPMGEPFDAPPAEFIDPCPESLWSATPDARISSAESVTLAFMAALEQLSSMQRAALLLRDVLDFSAQEAAELLDKTPDAIESALSRARTTVAARKPSQPKSSALLQRYLRAWEAKTPDALASLLREDALLTMPPLRTWFRGADAILAFYRQLMPTLPTLRVEPITISGGDGVAVWANGQPASLSALRYEGDRIVSIDTYLLPQLFAKFGLPS